MKTSPIATIAGGLAVAALLAGCAGGSDERPAPDAAEEPAAPAADGGAIAQPQSEEEFVDQHDLAIGETGYISTTLGELAYTIDDVEFTGFWELMDEHGYSPHSTFDPEAVAIATVTIENLDGDVQAASDAAANLEFDDGPWIQEHRSGQGGFIRAGDPDFDIDDLIDGDIAPGESATGTIYFPVFDTAFDSWGVTMQAGIVGCCATNELTWTFDADPGVDVAADEAFRD